MISNGVFGFAVNSRIMLLTNSYYIHFWGYIVGSLTHLLVVERVLHLSRRFFGVLSSLLGTVNICRELVVACYAYSRMRACWCSSEGRRRNKYRLICMKNIEANLVHFKYCKFCDFLIFICLMYRTELSSKYTWISYMEIQW